MYIGELISVSIKRVILASDQAAIGGEKKFIPLVRNIVVGSFKLLL